MQDTLPLLGFYNRGRKTGTFDDGIRLGLRACTGEPGFSCSALMDPTGAAPGSVYRVTDVKLASRLSFFLWSDIPD